MALTFLSHPLVRPFLNRPGPALVKYFKAGSNWLNLGGVPELGKGGRVDSTSPRL